SVKREVTPGARGKEWMQDNPAVRRRAQADQAGDQRIGKTRVVVVRPSSGAGTVAFLKNVPRDPLIGVGIEVFVDPGNHLTIGQTQMLREDVFLEEPEVVLVRDVALRLVVFEIGQTDQHMGRGKWPGRSVPLALIGICKAETRAAALRRCRTIFPG